MKKIIAAVCLLLASGALVWYGSSFFNTMNNSPSLPSQSTTESESTSTEPFLEAEPIIQRLSFSATGDNLIHDGIYQQAKARAEKAGKSGYDFSFCYKNMKSFYNQFDINWINQETLVTDTLEPSTYPCFSTPGDMGRELYSLGFRVFNLSNNHTYDKGETGLEETLKFWASMPDDVIISGLYAGSAHYNDIPIQEIDGVKIAYLAYTEHTNGIKTPTNAPANVIYTNELQAMENQLAVAREKADLVIVSVHWGVEGSHEIQQHQRDLAQQLVNWGADVIIGTHPHVIQNAEWMQSSDGTNSFVAYSLGNFLSAQSTADTMIGTILTFTIEKIVNPDETSETHIKDPKFIGTVNHYESNFSQISMYLLSDYTDELAATHGVRNNFPGFNKNYILSVLENTIDTNFL